MGIRRSIVHGPNWSVDTTRWPLLVCTQKGPISDAEFARSQAAAARALDVTDRPYTLLMDSRDAVLSAAQREKLHEAAKARAEKRRALCRGIAIVTDSSLTRGCLTALMWLIRPDVPTKIFATVEPAEDWCRTRLDRCDDEDDVPELKPATSHHPASNDA